MNIPAALRAATVLSLVAGVACQFVQRTDPTFPLLYFTVCSAVLLAVTLTAAALRPQAPGVDGVRGAATVGVVLSGIVFATVIAPAANGGAWFAPHDDVWVRAANVLLHGVGPVLAVVDFVLHPPAAVDRQWRRAASWCLWPLAWACVALPLDLSGVAEVPYDFLRIRAASDVPLVLGAMAALFVVVTLLGRGLLGILQLRGGPRGRS